ncbi:calcitonin gene-related peptide type 1 receptor-like isoform X1 [Mytilus edulis]|uniref:calcitonin gene-related peptide type 1 receptor-like isoform X1 n=1 Tax=Mytilus edulis TaxID=6550 RepID=UPI0039EEF11E
MEGYCQTRFHYLNQKLFNLLTCSMCYQYLFPKNKELRSKGLFLEATSESRYKEGTQILANISNSTFVRNVCKTLEAEGDCARWTDCCNSAIKCCKDQLAAPFLYNGTSHCPRIWDGYGCFGDTLPGVREYIQCPSYIEHGVTHANAFKDCTENGSWYVDPLTNKTWTDYTSCVPIEHPMILVYMSLACNIISLLLLVPSCAIFLAFKQLRSQHRIKLHICFFTSFILVSVVALMWDFLVHSNRLTTSADSTLQKNTSGCKLLNALLRYTQTSNYFWMFCEGFYLHRLIVHAFKVPKGLLGYYVMGWGIAWVPVVIYCIIRATDEDLDERCWVTDAGHYEWIIFIPNVLCLFMNVVFFVNILRILLTQLQSHPNEPSNYRRALKATFVLIPLFGIQWGFVIHRPGFTLWYEVVRIIVQYTQGAIVSLVFCIFNGEVHSHLKSCLRKKWPSAFRDDPGRFQSTVSGTQYSHVSSGRRGTQQTDHYIPLNTVPDDQSKQNGHVG